MTGILKVDQWKDSGDNALISSNGSGALTINSSANNKLAVTGGSLNVEDGYAYGYGDNSYRIEGKDDGANARIAFITGNSEIARFTTSGLAIGGTGAANTLDDYEEGSFTPSLDIETGSNISVSTIQGYYRKIGNLVAFTIFCLWDKTSGSANMKFSGLPFTCSNQTNLARQAVHWQQGAYTDQGAFFGGAVFGSSTDVYFVDSKHGSFNSNFDTNNAGRIANTTGIRSFVNGTYFTT